MSFKPVIFISAVSKELRSARTQVAKTLAFLGYEAEWQDIFGTEQGDVKVMLRRKVDVAAGVIQLVGHCYGFEPGVPDTEFGRVSYTQYEALYAKKRGKQVWYLLVGDGFPADAHEPEGEDLQQLQRAYSEKVKAQGDLYYFLRDAGALETSVLKLRNELARLRRRWKQFVILVLASLVVLLALGAWQLLRQQRMEEVVIRQSRDLTAIRQDNEKFRQALNKLPDAVKETMDVGQWQGETVILARAYRILEERLHLENGMLEKELPVFAAKLLVSRDTSTMERASALYATRTFATAETAALEAKDLALAAAGSPVADAVAALSLAAQAARGQFQFDRALEHYRAAAALTDQKRDPREWAEVQRCIGSILRSLGRYQESWELASQGQRICGGLLGTEDPITLHFWNNQAVALGLWGKYDAAEREFRRLLSVLKRVQGAEHGDMLRVSNNLADVLRSLARYQEAETVLREVADIKARVLGALHRETLVARVRLGVCLEEQNRVSEAQRVFVEVSGQLESTCGPEDLDTLWARRLLASVHLKQGRVMDAEHALREILAVQVRRFGQSDFESMSTLVDLSENLVFQGRGDEALGQLQEASGTYAKLLGQTHPETLRINASIAAVLLKLGRHREAEAQTRSVLVVRELVLGPDHPDTLRTCQLLAACLLLQDRRLEADPLLERAHAGLALLLGEDHPETQRDQLALKALPPIAGTGQSEHVGYSAQSVVKGDLANAHRLKFLKPSGKLPIKSDHVAFQWRVEPAGTAASRYRLVIKGPDSFDQTFSTTSTVKQFQKEGSYQATITVVSPEDASKVVQKATISFVVQPGMGSGVWLGLGGVMAAAAVAWWVSKSLGGSARKKRSLHSDDD